MSSEHYVKEGTVPKSVMLHQREVIRRLESDLARLDGLLREIEEHKELTEEMLYSHLSEDYRVGFRAALNRCAAIAAGRKQGASR